ncbi:MAG: ABC-F family ATP-binding cassette domain-containing protein [Clostridia bacterium]
MAILQVSQLKKSFNGETLLEDINFQLVEGDKAALIGPNGCGKSTLFRILLGTESYEDGEIYQAKGTRMAYLAQVLEEDSLSLSLWEFMLEEYADLIILRNKLKSLEKIMATDMILKDPISLQEAMNDYAKAQQRYEHDNGYNFETAIKEVIFGLGFSLEDMERSFATYSGGQKTRLYLARILLRKPDILLLDEPNNYLDLQAMEWLEKYLQNFSGTLLLISHDRYFLDQVVNKVLEIEHKNIKSYKGNYSEFALQKEFNRLATTKEYEKQQKKIRDLEDYISRYKAGIKSKQARGRASQLGRLERVNKPGEHKGIGFQFQEAENSGEQVLVIKEMTISFPGRMLLEKIDYILEKSNKVALVGPNGSGKTTLLKAVIGEAPYEGKIRLGANVRPAYFDQEHEHFLTQGNLLDEMLAEGVTTLQEARDLLARFGFRGEDVYKSVISLSGGEESRLMLTKLFLQKANFLILDEPTNHLDIYSREALEEALEEYNGTLLFVSHDRYFINKVANRVLDLSEHHLIEYLGDYDYYRYKKKQLANFAQAGKNKEEKEQQDNQLSKQTPKTSRRERATLAVRLREAEKQVSQLEAKKDSLCAMLSAAGCYEDYLKAEELNNQLTEVEAALTQAYEVWEEVMLQTEE